MIPIQNKKHRFLTGLGIAVMTIITTYLVHTNPALNLADLTSKNVTGDLADVLYMPTYEGGIGEEGLLEIKTKANINTFNSITFALNYSPVDGLEFENNPIIYDPNTLFQNAAFEMTAQPEAGKLITTIILNQPKTINTSPLVCSDFDNTNMATCEAYAACTWVGPSCNGGAIPIDAADDTTHPTLFKLNTKLNDLLPEGQKVDITFTDLALLDGVNPLAIPSMPATNITVTGQNELRVIKAEALDSTHVAIEFSDLLDKIGNTANYTPSPALNVNDVEVGTLYGLTQRHVVLTTDAQTAAQEYVITVTSNDQLVGNQQGKVDVNYSLVPFYGFGDGSNVLSDFAIESASVSGYKNINVVFTDDVKAASVSKTDFALAEQGGGAIAIDNVSSITNNQVVLTVSTPLLKEKTYLLSAVSPNAILRNSDSAILGMDRVAFTGSKNGPRLLTAKVMLVNGKYRLTLTFDENIQLAGVANNPVGRLYVTGTAAGTTINDFNIGAYNQTISGSTLTLENASFNAPNTNFTFAVSAPGWLENSMGVPVEDTYKSISFWGFGHDDQANSVGTVQVDKKDAIKVPPGTLDFNQVVQTDLSILYDNGGANLVTEPISSFGLVNGTLEIVTTNDLDPDRHYILRIVDNNINNNTLAAKDFAVKRELSLISAQPLSTDDVRVFFSENIDQRDVDATDFAINDGGIAINNLTIDPNFQSVILETAGPFNPGVIYKATLSNAPDVYSFEGDYTLKNSVFFTGYNTQAAKSPVKLSSVDVLNAQTLRMNFTGELDEASFTPVNLDIFWFFDPGDPTKKDPLTITSITKIDPDTYELKTGIQQGGENYFVVFDGVADSNGLLLGNTGVQNFFGFQLPKASISLVTPSVMSNDLETNVVVSGNNLDIVEEVRLGNEIMTIVSQSKTSLVFTVPEGFEDDLYNITLIDKANNSLVFENALLVTVPEQELTVHSEQSQAIPFSVPNDGTTTTKLWLLVEDPVGLSTISSVVVDLSQIGGPSTQEMVKDAGTQPLFSQWYTFETTIPETVATQDEPYLLPVEVRKGSEIFEGTISIRVSKDVIMSVAPQIDSVYISPVTVPPDGETPVKISAQVSDLDGAATISSVVADLGALGIGFKPLTAISEVTEGTELETQFFESEEFTVPDTTQIGSYDINVVASDTSGEKTTQTIKLQVSTDATGPKIDPDVSYVAPRKSIPRDGKTQFSIHAFVSDPDGVSDIQTVTANFSSIGLAPVSLQKDAEAASDGEDAWYSATGLTIPKTSPLGTHDIEVRATDSNGGISNILLRIEVTHKDTVGEPPRVVDERSYTTPTVAVNDGATPVTLYTFIEDDDDDVESVVVNLSAVGQVGTSTNGTMGGNETEGEISDGNCPTGSNVIVCMNPSVKEGGTGQWYILPGVTISESTVASPNPYQIEVVVTDAGGKSTKGIIPLFVGSGDSIEDQQVPPRALAAIPTSETSIEVLFNKELLASSVLGKAFTITSDSDVRETLHVVGATITPSGTVVTLSTGNQVPGKRYVLSVSSDIKDIVGRSVLEGAQNRLPFEGFKPLNRAPVLEYISPTASNKIELEFRDNLKPTSVRTGTVEEGGAGQFGIEIYESENTTERLDVLGVKLLAPGNIIEITTDNQKPEQRYRINIVGLASYDGTSLPVAINKGFKGFNQQIALHLAAANLADLNNDGRVDFADFTIFSSVYGTVYFGAGENLEEAAASAQQQAADAQQQQAGQPIEPNPDATVPITSEPAGGQTP